MYVFKIILLFLFSFHVCANNLERYLLSTFEIEKLIQKELSSDILKLPPGTHHSLLKFNTYDLNFNQKMFCLNLRVSEKVEPGELYLVSIKENCEESLMAKNKLWKSPYYNFEISLEGNKFYLLMDDKKIKFSLINKKELKNTKFSSHVAQNSFGSVEIGLSQGGITPMKIKDGEICKQVNDDCEIVFAKCDQCLGGSYYFKNNSCTKAYSKVCGINNCGVRGEVACLRGSVSTGLKDYCIQDSPIGFCSDGSRVACVNETLICE